MADVPTVDDALRQGRAFEDAGDYNRAELEYRRALRHDPTHAEALHAVGFIGQKTGRFDLAVEFMERAVAAAPRNAVFRGNLGAAYQILGRLDEAAACLREAIELQPGFADAHFNLGVVLNLLQRPDEAIDCYRTAVRLFPESSAARNNLGSLLLLHGQIDEAEEQFRQAADFDANNPHPHHNLGRIEHIRNQLPAAQAHYERALAADPRHVEALYYLGTLYQQQQRPEEAIAQLRAAVQVRPDYFDAQRALGVFLFQNGHTHDAIAPLEAAVGLKPENPEIHYLLGVIQACAVRREEALDSFRQAVALKPDFIDALNEMGVMLLARHETQAAVDAFREVLKINPELAIGHFNLGNALKELGELDEAISCFQRTLELEPNNASTFNNLASTYDQKGMRSEAKAALQQGIEIDPNHAQLLSNLGHILAEEGEMEQAESLLRRSHAAQPSNKLRYVLAAMLPPIYESKSDLEQRRTKLLENIAGLVRDQVVLDFGSEEISPNFYAAYQGKNDRELQQLLARLYSRPSGDGQSLLPRPAGAPRDGRIRIGFVSMRFKNHTIGHLTRGIIDHLSREKFSVTAVSIGRNTDEISDRIRRNADEFIELPLQLDTIRRELARQAFDIVFYPDVGMDPYTYSLCFSRFAPVQCVTFGHPVTTGVETVDYYISSGLMEPDDADEHYSERLVRLNSVPTFYYRPDLPPPVKDRRQLGLDEHSHLYLCLQSLFKMHPDFAEILGGILRGDPAGQVVLLAAKHARWNELLQARFRRTLPDVMDRIQFVPNQTRPDFLNMMAVSEVMLDTIHFGGGNTSLEGLAMGTPIVTLPGEFMRGRVTSACYRKMGMHECIARTPQEYIEIALRLGGDPVFRQRVHARILSTNHVLYEDAAMVRELEQFFEDAHHAAQRGATWQPAVHPLESAAARPTPPLAAILRSCTCPACAHHVAVPFYDGGCRPLTTQAWPQSPAEAQALPRLQLDFVRCVDCGHVYNAAFDYAAVPYERPYQMFNKGLAWKNHLRRFRDLVLARVPQRATIVEIGCGDGHLLRALAQARPTGRYIGFDPGGAIDTGDGAIEDRPELFRPERHLRELRPDLIISRHVLEHLQNPLGFVQELAFAAAWDDLDTQILFEVPCIDHVFASGRTVDFFYEHHSHFTTTSLHRLLSRCAGDVELVERGYNDEVVYGLARLCRRSTAVDFASAALDFQRRAAAAQETVCADLQALGASGKKTAIWGGAGKAAAFINQYGLDADRFPLVVDSDPQKTGTYVPGTGQQIQFRDVLKDSPVDVVLIATQWRANDIVMEIERCGIRCASILLEHQGRIIDYFRDEHPYRSQARAA